MTKNFVAFAVRSTMLPRIPGNLLRVNPVLRFSSHKKSPRDVGPTGSVALQSGFASLNDPPDDCKHAGSGAAHQRSDPETHEQESTAAARPKAAPP